jgi:2-iminobutanoate/2-iminopropanoate deaminase
LSKPIGPYTPLVRAGPWLICSGQLGVEQTETGPVLVSGGVEAQTRRALRNVGELLATMGSGWEDVAKVTVFLDDISNFAVVNAVYVEELGDNRPARSMVGVAGLPMGGQVEVEAWAYVEPA